MSDKHESEFQFAEDGKAEQVNSPSQIEELQQKCSSLEDQLKRSLADYQNLLRRTQSEREQMRLYGSESILTLLIPTLDNFYYALKSFGSSNQESENLINSFRMIWACLLKALEEVGFKYLEPGVGESFNAQYHEAVNKLESDLPEGVIAETYRPGYALHERILKPAQVAVSMPKTTAAPPSSINP